MGRGRGSFSRVAARATCRAINSHNRYGSSISGVSSSLDDDTLSFWNIILGIFCFIIYLAWIALRIFLVIFILGLSLII